MHLDRCLRASSLAANDEGAHAQLLNKSLVLPTIYRIIDAEQSAAALVAMASGR